MKISTLLFICALALSSVAAYYSIVGLATIFSASFYAVVVMAGILEISKLVCASWLYQKWHNINALIKVYLTTAVVVLMLITSLGIFGFLSRAHVDQQLGNKEVSLKIEQIDAQVGSVREIMDRYRSQLTQLDRSINIQLDANRATQALAARQRQVAERDQIRQKLDSEQQNLQKLEQAKMELKQKMSVLESEVGPIKYVAEFFVQNQAVDVEKAVRWMIVVIVLVFDPLAVFMLIAANMTLMNERKQIEMVEINNKLPPTDAIMPPPVTDNLTGKIDLKYDFSNRTLMYFDGKAWIPTELGLTKSTIESHDIIDTQTLKNIEELLKTVLSQQQNTTGPASDVKLNLDQIRQEVKHAMDSWLTTASNDVHSTTQAEVNPVEDGTDTPTIEAVKVTVIPSETLSPSVAGNIELHGETTTIIKKPTSWI